MLLKDRILIDGICLSHIAFRFFQLFLHSFSARFRHWEIESIFAFGFASTFTYSFCLLLSTFAPSLLFSAFSSFDDLLSTLAVCNCLGSLLLLSVYALCI